MNNNKMPEIEAMKNLFDSFDVAAKKFIEDSKD